MRLVGAGLLVYAAMLALVALLGSWRVFDRAPAWVVGVGIALFGLGTCVLVMWLLKSKGSSPWGRRRTAAEHLAELERLGLLETTTFRATRAFEVQEFEDEGLHYFLELEDGRVLFLNGQYLYDYESITDDPENQPRKFPCTEFTVRRHRTERYAIDILCAGRVLEPEAVGPPFSKKAWAAKQVPEDGQVITSVGYDELRRTHT